MISTVETSIVKGLIHNETYTRRVLPYLKASYFESPVASRYYTICEEYFSKYDSCPSAKSLQVAIEDIDHISEEDYQELGQAFADLTEPEDTQTEWLVDTTEHWCKERAVFLALMDAISIQDGSDKDRGRDAIPGILSEALAVSFDDHVGHEYLADYNERLGDWLD